MIQLINDIINDTLKGRDNKFSSKKLMSSVSFNLCVFMALVDMFTKYKVNIELFSAFLIIAGYSTTLTVLSVGANKVIDNKKVKDVS